MLCCAREGNKKYPSNFTAICNHLKIVVLLGYNETFFAEQLQRKKISPASPPNMYLPVFMILDGSQQQPTASNSKKQN